MLIFFGYFDYRFGKMCNFANGKFGFRHMSMQDIKTIIAVYFKSLTLLKAWLFGSFARGEETPDSDVDILVEFDHSTSIGLLAYARMWRIKGKAWP